MKYILLLCILFWGGYQLRAQTQRPMHNYLDEIKNQYAPDGRHGDPGSENPTSLNAHHRAGYPSE